MEQKALIKLFKAISGCNLLVVGDFMIDRTIYGEASRISPEAPTPVIEIQEERVHLGGAGNVVRNIDSLGGKYWCAAVAGDDANSKLLEQELNDVKSCESLRIFREPGRKTTLKTRIVAVQSGRYTDRPFGHQQVARLDEETAHDISDEIAKAMLAFAQSAMSCVDGVVVSDYAKGALPESFLQALIELARKAHKPVFVDPKHKDFGRYRGATVLTPNAVEAESALGISFASFENSSSNGPGKAVQQQLRDLNLQAILVTRGANGVSLIDHDGFHHFPTTAREVFDVTGAGDTLIAAFSLAVSSGASLPDAAQFGNLAAGVAVSKSGAAAVYPFEVEREVEVRHLSTDSKIRSRDQIASLMDTLRREKRKIVFTNGCFDLLHVGHMYLLCEAKRLGDILVVGLNSDKSVKELKGSGRPIVSDDDRAYAIAALECVDYLVTFDEPDPLELIREIRPDVLVKGDDYKVENVVGAEFVQSYGGTTQLVPLRRGVSTSVLVEKIRSSQ